MAMLETPSRILKRIEALEAQDSDLPSLPSIPDFSDSGFQSIQASSAHSSPKNLRIEDDEDAVPYQSTPAPPSSQTTYSTTRPPSASSSATRFANLMRTSMDTARRSQQDSFEVSQILPTQTGNDTSSSASIPNVYLPPDDEATDDMLRMQDPVPTEAMAVTATHSDNDLTSPRSFVSNEPKHMPSSKSYEYSVSLASEPVASPLHTNRNVSIRKPLLIRTRTPSLSRTTPSPTSISSNSTPRSTYSVLPRGNVSPIPSEGEHPELEEPHPHVVPHVDYEEQVSSQNLQEDQHDVEYGIEEGNTVDQCQDEHQNSSPEPTFSSEEHDLSFSEPDQARTPFPKAFLSPMQPSNAFPTPIHPSRSCDTVADAMSTPISGPSGVQEDFATPYNRRRSFLLSLVHSTTRPRMAFPTPHPRGRAAPTPRPRAHHLSQAWTPSPAHLTLNSRSNPSSGSSHSPHDRLSFISTASSHDLTVHPRANTSFDPTIGAKGVGRFNAVKLNTYLHGLNRRLQEENETLVSRLKMHGEEVELGKMAEELERDGFQGIEEAVLDDVAAMRDELKNCELEKCVMKRESDALVDSIRQERDEAIRELETEREAREQDNQRWKNRMAEVERGVEDVIKGLEKRLEEAERDASRLNHLLSESPTREAIDNAKDTRIELLEKEKDQLTERVRALTSTALTPSPSKEVDHSHNTPVAHRQVLVWRTPKTPGSPLKDYSWLHDDSVLHKATPLVVQIERLQQELHLANDSIDEKVDLLEEAGMGIVGLTEKLEDARARTVTLEGEVGRLTRREDRQLRRLERARCLKCNGRIDLSKLIGTSGGEQSSEDMSSISMPSGPRTPPKTTESLRLALHEMNAQLSTLRSQWETERKELVNEKAVLQDAANRLNVELGAVRDEAKQALKNGHQELSDEARARNTIENELGKAKLAVTNLENNLKDEQQKMRALSTEQNRLSCEKEEILVKLQGAQLDMDNVRAQLENVKRDNRGLEAELRATATVDQRARFLEAKVSENQEIIESLRNERESLVAEHDTLQRRYVEASAQVDRLRQKLSASQSSHDERRHQLDLRVNEIESLRREISEQARELEKMESEKNQARADQSGIVRSVTSLELDLKRVISDAEALGRDLKDLKTERDVSETRHRNELDKANRAQKQLCAQLRLANEQLEAQREKTKKALADRDNHVCQSDYRDVAELRAQHKTECKGLMVQLRYLKAKFTRESVFRKDLCYQKRYLLDILSTFESSERQIQAAIARIGFPLSSNQPGQGRRTLRSIATVILFITRTRRSSKVWREQSAPKTAVQAALQDVRRRRIGGSLGYT